MSEVENNTGAVQTAAAPEKAVKKAASTKTSEGKKAAVKKAPVTKAAPKAKAETTVETEKEAATETEKSLFKNTEKAGETRAAEIAEKLQVETVWENHKGEFFTSENLALNSVPTRKHLRKHIF